MMRGDKINVKINYSQKTNKLDYRVVYNVSMTNQFHSRNF